MKRSVTLFLCWVIVVQCNAENLSICFTGFTAVFNGKFDNSDQAKDGNYDVLQAMGTPVLIPALQKKPVPYAEELINGDLYRRLIIIRNESSTDYRLDLTYYNLKLPGQYKPETFDIDGLTNFTREDFRLDEGCQQSFTKPSVEVVFGESWDCRHGVNWRHPIYTAYFECNSFRFEPPLESAETASLVAYELERRGPRYPLIGAPEGYVNPCPDGEK